MAAAPIPSSKGKHLRACLLCSIVMEAKDFKKEGCPNCEEISKMRGDSDRVQVCTSSNFEGLIALIDPQNSWVGRWQRVSNYTRGIYAARVTGPLPHDIRDELDARGIKPKPRDDNTGD